MAHTACAGVLSYHISDALRKRVLSPAAHAQNVQKPARGLGGSWTGAASTNPACGRLRSIRPAAHPRSGRRGYSRSGPPAAPRRRGPHPPGRPPARRGPALCWPSESGRGIPPPSRTRCGRCPSGSTSHTPACGSSRPRPRTGIAIQSSCSPRPARGSPDRPDCAAGPSAWRKPRPPLRHNRFSLCHPLRHDMRARGGRSQGGRDGTGLRGRAGRFGGRLARRAGRFWGGGHRAEGGTNSIFLFQKPRPPLAIFLFL